MILSFKEFLNEAVFKNGEFTEKLNKREKEDKGSITYGKAVINKLVNGESVKLGKDGKAGEFDIKHLGKLATKLGAVDNVKDFNLIINGYDPKAVEGLDKKKLKEIENSFKYRWTKIFKGDFSGNPEGPSTKGHKFEDDFAKMIQAGIDDPDNASGEFEKLKEVIGLGPDGTIDGMKPTGSKNTKRPFNFDGSKMWIGKPSNKDKEIPDIGEDVSDVTLQTSKGPVYLSLKFGSTNSVLNLGIERLFPKGFFEGSELDEKTGAKELLKCLCIDEDKFRQTFVSYEKKKNEKNVKTEKQEKTSFRDSVKEKEEKEKEEEGKEIEVNAVGKFTENDDFKNLILQAFGYGYILVHKSGRKNREITYRDFRDENTVKNYIIDKNGSKFENATVLYGGKSGEGKRVEVNVNYANVLILKVVIRNTQGKIYPDKLQVIYEFLPENIIKN